MTDTVFVTQTGERVSSPNTKEQLCVALLNMSAEIEQLRASLANAQRESADGYRRCWNRAPESLVRNGIPCQLNYGHGGSHWSTSGCAGSEIHWDDPAVSA